MKLTLKRNKETVDALYGQLFIDDVFQCFTMERTSVAIPLGQYTIEFTFSPHFQKIMPLLNVPGREGIRIHIANFPDQLEGCIAVGTFVGNDYIESSRDAYTALMSKIEHQANLVIQIVKDF